MRKGSDPPSNSKTAQAPEKRLAINVKRVIDYGHSENGDLMILMFELHENSKLLVRIPYSEASSLLGALQGASTSAASVRGEKVNKELSNALTVANVDLGPTESGRVGVRFDLTNGMHFDFVVTKSFAGKLAKALSKYSDYKESGGSDYAH